ncbi:CoA transferase subunit A [Leifsonia sp. NPDC058194]|uniref:CoA transferase subunit A n=1 Tax=Leifsonia sp. NPDC058194 TaxID=3346374 RepID=UPI0036DCF397
MDKVVRSAAEAVAGLADGSSIAVGGFGLCGIPSVLIAAVLEGGASRLDIVSNNCGVDGKGLGLLLEAGRIQRITASYVGENREFARQYLSGELEVRLTPQGTLAEKLRSGGAGIPAFYTKTGVGTVVEHGGLPWRYAADGTVALASPPLATAEFDVAGEPSRFVLEMSITCDWGLVRAAKADRHGNLVFHSSARNFNPLCATAARYTVVEAEELVEPGDLDPDEIHLPGAFVDAVVVLAPDEVRDKSIEKRVTREKASG